jgi:Protein of unknown function (DUF2934)
MLRLGIFRRISARETQGGVMVREFAGRRPAGMEEGTMGADTIGEPVQANQSPPAKGSTPPRGVPRTNAIRPLSLVPHRLTAAERHRRICELAFRRAEQRGFAPGGEVEDWLDAEREVDAGRY